MALNLEKKREKTALPEFTKKVGLFEAKVIAINPDAEEYNDVLGIEVKEESKAVEYLGTSQDGNKTLRVDFWLQDIKTEDKFKVTFFLEDKDRENKDGTKKQYINNVGTCTWADDENNLPDVYNAITYWRVSQTAKDFFVLVRNIFENWNEYKLDVNNNKIYDTRKNLYHIPK